MAISDDDLKYLQGALGSLENYLLSNEIYYPLGGGYTRGMVSSRLSLGALLLTIVRVQALSGPEGSTIPELKKIDELRQQWRVHWEKKAAREFASRLTLWQNALAELESASNQDQGVYRVEIRNRVMVELLRRDAGDLPDQEISRLVGQDHRLRARFVPAEFVWEPELQQAFPQTEFWYLYGQVRQ